MAVDYRKNMVEALANGLLAIEAFESAGAHLTLADVASRAGLTRAAARRYLHTLCALGYADHDGKRFRLTPRVLKLGYAFISAEPLPNLAQPILEQIGARTGRVAFLGVLDTTDVVFLARSTPRHTPGGVVGVGGRMSAFNSSTGRVLLATKRDAVIEKLLKQAGRPKRLTTNTKTTLQDVLREVRRARIAGYAINNEEIEMGLRSVAVPVVTSKGTVVAGISLSLQTPGPALQDAVAEALPILRAASRSLGDML